MADGKNLGRVCDLAFYFPEGKLKGFFVTGSKGFRLTKSDVFIPIGDVMKIGEDVVLVKPGKSKPPKGDCPPQLNCPPPCPPNNRPPYPPQSHCPPYNQPDPRRNFDDYE